MRCAIIGYGKMGHEIEKILIERGHTVGLIIDADNSSELNTETLNNIDVALEFTAPDAAYGNITRCLECGTAVVSGTTGWLSRFDEVKRLCAQRGGAIFYASNYCLGVNLLFKVNEMLAQMVKKLGIDYDVHIEETHHTQKKDSPSGTAITLAEQIISALDTKTEWVNHPSNNSTQLEIISRREGNIAGIHSVMYESCDDSLTLRHEIRNRRTLAYGAVLAAEFLCGKSGVYSMNDLLDC